MKTLPEKFSKRIFPVTESGCWIWMGGVHDKGYGIYSRPDNGRKMMLAHRYAFETLRGLVPEGLQLDHLCRVRLCVNPDHLEIVTRKENILRGFAPPAICARQTHCPKGHPYSPENLLQAEGHRRCLTCRVEYEYQRNLRRYTPKVGRGVRNVKTGRSTLIEESRRRTHLQALSEL